MTKSHEPTAKTRTTTQSLPVTAAIAAKVIGLGRRQFDRLVTAGVLPRAAPRLFDLVKVGPAYFQYVRDGKAGSTAIGEARLAYLQAQRRALDQRTRERARELIELLEVRRVFDASMATIGAQLDGLSGRCAAELAAITDPAIVREKLAEEVHRVRTAAAADLAALVDPVIGGEDPDAAAETDRRPVGRGQ